MRISPIKDLDCLQESGCLPLIKHRMEGRMELSNTELKKLRGSMDFVCSMER